MPAVRLTSNTTKEYPCTNCGADGNIIREGATNPRLKCNSCGFLYDGQDSEAAKKAGSIPEGPPELPIEEEKVEDAQPNTGIVDNSVDTSHRLPLYIPLPRSPTHVLLTKDRRDFEFVTKRTLKKEVLKWTAGGKSFDLFELTLKKVDAKVDIN